MKSFTVTAILSSFALFLIGCTLPRIMQPLRLYDLKNGNTIEVTLNPTSRDHGTIISSNDQGEQFQGEYVIYDRTTNWNNRLPGYLKGVANGQPETQSADFAELYASTWSDEEGTKHRLECT